MSNEFIEKGAEKALEQKLRLQKEGGYIILPTEIPRRLLPELVKKYGGRTARDAFTLFMYLHSYVNGSADNALYMWAFPAFEDIVKDTGIHRNRISTLVAILKAEGLIKTSSVASGGHRKNVYLPLFYAEENV